MVNVRVRGCRRTTLAREQPVAQRKSACSGSLGYRFGRSKPELRAVAEEYCNRSASARLYVVVRDHRLADRSGLRPAEARTQAAAGSDGDQCAQEIRRHLRERTSRSTKRWGRIDIGHAACCWAGSIRIAGITSGKWAGSGSTTSAFGTRAARWPARRTAGRVPLARPLGRPATRTSGGAGPITHLNASSSSVRPRSRSRMRPGRELSGGGRERAAGALLR
jgi:hypothetical protein